MGDRYTSIKGGYNIQPAVNATEVALGILVFIGAIMLVYIMYQHNILWILPVLGFIVSMITAYTVQHLRRPLKILE